MWGQQSMHMLCCKVYQTQGCCAVSSKVPGSQCTHCAHTLQQAVSMLKLCLQELRHGRHHKSSFAVQAQQDPSLPSTISAMQMLCCRLLLPAACMQASAPRCKLCTQLLDNQT